MLENIDLRNILVIDIETAPQYARFEDMNETWRELWSKKMKYYIKDDVTATTIYERAGIYSEFGKIICITAGRFIQDEMQYSLRIKSFYGEDEKKILSEFSEMLNKFANITEDEYYVAAHNGKEFDFPYISRRCLINGCQIPYLLNNSGKKPWEVRLLDTMEMWKFGDYKNYTSLDLLAASFGINSPKDDIDGSKVGGLFWNEKDTERIKNYCCKDVVTVAQLLMRFKGMELLKDVDIAYTN